MSIKIMSAIFENEVLGPTERLIMLALADHSDDAGQCYPSMSRLCKRTGLTERAVQSNIRKLSKAGYVTIKDGGGRGKTNLYIVRAEPLNPAGETPNEMHPAGETPFLTTLNPAYDDIKPRRRCTRTLKNHQEPSNISREKKNDLLNEEQFPKVDPLENTLKDFYEVFPKRTDKKHSTPAAIRPVLKAALKKIKSAELLTAAKNYADHGNHENGRYARKAIYWLREEEWEKYQAMEVQPTQLSARYQEIINRYGGGK